MVGCTRMYYKFFLIIIFSKQIHLWLTICFLAADVQVLNELAPCQPSIDSGKYKTKLVLPYEQQLDGGNNVFTYQTQMLQISNAMKNGKKLEWVTGRVANQCPPPPSSQSYYCKSSKPVNNQGRYNNHFVPGRLRFIPKFTVVPSIDREEIKPSFISSVDEFLFWEPKQQDF